ncbi:MAG: aspartyl protease family protein [Chitinophagaceae bacterium]|nr:aspartyl protease family protein [Chitinophagaceae bacterium]
MKRIFCVLSIGLLYSIAISQEVLTPQKKAQFITRFPFKQYSGGVMIVQARLNDIPDTLNFILDTGSGGISLDSSTCTYFGIQPKISDTFVTGMGSAHKARFVYDQQLHFQGLTVNDLDFHVNNYDVLTSVYGEKIDGIIGYSFFKQYIVKVNFDSLELEIFKPGEIRYPKQGTLLRPAFTSLPIQNLHVKDGRKVDFNFYFDTGAGLCFLMSEAFAKDSAVLSGKRRLITTQAEGMGGKLQMQLTVVKQLQVGRYKFRNVPTYIFRDEYNVTSYPYVGGLLGNDLLRRFNLIINYPQREIHLEPNSHFFDAFDYAYTGMATYFVDGKILIDDVVPGSPAEKAGLKVDDILVGVGANFSNNIMQYKTILQNSDQKISLVIRRNGEIMQLYIKPSSIL